jgi:hypothetical protein
MPAAQIAITNFANKNHAIDPDNVLYFYVPSSCLEITPLATTKISLSTKEDTRRI